MSQLRHGKGILIVGRAFEKVERILRYKKIVARGLVRLFNRIAEKMEVEAKQSSRECCMDAFVSAGYSKIKGLKAQI
jgi:hypothetical protein